MVAYDNPYGVLTNSPDFPWHSTNMANYINLKPENIDDMRLGEITISNLVKGQGC